MKVLSAIRRAGRIRPGRLAAPLIALVAAGGFAVVGSAAPAHADAGTGCYQYRFLSSHLELEPDGGSVANGARLVQGDGLPGQPQFEWCPTPAGTIGGTPVYQIRNQNSGLCISTDGRSTDWLRQQTCLGQLGQLWVILRANYNGNDVCAFLNYEANLAADVYEDSRSVGAPIDAYRYTGGANQYMYPLAI